MHPFSYLSVLTSIVLALGITRIMTGLGKLLQARSRVRIYWVHLFWAFNVFLFQTLNWWILYRWQNRERWTFFLFLFLLLSPTLSFLLSVLLFPDSIEDGADMKQYFYANQRWFFMLGALLAPIDGVDTLLKGWAHFQAQGLIYPLTLALVFVLNMVAAFNKRERFHAFFAVFFMLYLLAFITINLHLLT